MGVCRRGRDYGCEGVTVALMWLLIWERGFWGCEVLNEGVIVACRCGCLVL